MKKLHIYITIFVAGLGIFVASCTDDFLDIAPKGVLAESTLGNIAGLDGLLIAAYGELDGFVNIGPVWDATATNWVMCDVASDDAYKGTDAGDQPPMNPVERNEHDPASRVILTNWLAWYDGIARANDVIKIATATEGLEASAVEQYVAESRFLRAHYHFNLVRLFGPNVPYVDENAPLDGLIPNSGEIWANIEADLTAAASALPSSQIEVGRATSWAAKGILGRVQLYQGNYSGTLSLMNEIINSGQFSMLPNYGDVQGTAGNNGPHAIFQVQMSVNDGVPDGQNGNYGEVLNNPHNGVAGGGCCGFFQPSHNFVNSFKTVSGLPTADFNAVDLGNDVGCFSALADCCTQDGDNCTIPYAVDQAPVDPRLDHSVGRKGIPYLDWGLHTGINYVRDQSYGGPFSPKKRVFKVAEQGTNSVSGHSWGANGATAINYNVVRYADVLLMAAEAEIEGGNATRGVDLINEVRSRMKDNPDQWVKMPDGSNAANYEIELYGSLGQSEAREALRFERRLEFGMEGHRLFDLNRWGITTQVMNEYYTAESVTGKRSYLIGASFAPHRVINPIPQQAIDRSVGTLTQNPGY
ncbi:MAG: hypothetical protein ACI9FN_001108 [Saprospiraceae bacterium]|jgi:hypothetical protein